MRRIAFRPVRLPGLLVSAMVAVSVGGAGCLTASSPNVIWQEEPRGPGSARVVVAPLNLALRLDLDLEEVVEPVADEIIRHLQSLGARVAVIWPPDAWSLWRDSMAAAGGEERHAPDLETAAAAFVRALSEHAEFDLAVMPALVYREARVVGRYARWDGVRRRVSVLTRATGDPDVPAAGWKGRITGLSLHVLAYTPDGRRTHQGWGGIDLVHDAVVAPGGSPGHSFLRLQKDLLGNPDHIHQGVALAFDRSVMPGPR